MYGRQNGLVLFCFVFTFYLIFFVSRVNKWKEIFHLEVTGQITITYNIKMVIFIH